MAKTSHNPGRQRTRADDDDRKRPPLRPGQAKAPGAPTQRMLRVGEMIRHELAAMLARGDIHDETLAASAVTIPEVRMSTDLKLATVYVMPLGGLKVPEVVAALELNKKYIRSVVAKSINLKFAPDIRFKHDATFDEASRIDRLLESPKVRQDLGKP